MSALPLASKSRPGVLRGIEDPHEAAARRLLAEQLRLHKFAFLIRPDGEGLTVELHSRRGQQSVWHALDAERVAEMLADVASAGTFGVVLHVDTPEPVLQRLVLIRELAAARPGGTA